MGQQSADSTQWVTGADQAAVAQAGQQITGGSRSTSHEQEIRTLEQGKAIERELAGGETHSYAIVLASSQYLQLVFHQRGIDVRLSLLGPDGQRLLEVDSRKGALGPQPLALIADASGTYHLEVRSLEKDAIAGRYEVNVEEQRAAAAHDGSRIAAQKIFAEGEQLRAQGTAEALRTSIEKYETAVPLWRAGDDRRWEAATLHNVGSVYGDLGEQQKALQYLNEALPLRRAVGDPRGEGATLNNIGNAYTRLGEPQKALDYYQQALPLRRVVGDRQGEAAAQHNIGVVYANLGERQKALEHYEQALPLWRAVSDPQGEAATLNSIGAAYDVLGEKQKALDYLNQALSVRRAIGDRRGEAGTLHNIAIVYSFLGEKQKALAIYHEALPLRRAVGDRRGEASTLHNIALVYGDLGEQQKALETYHLALSLMRAVGNRQGEATALNNIGRVHGERGEREKALEFLDQALQLRRAVGDQLGVAGTLTRIGMLYGELGEQEKALEYLNQALPIRRALKDVQGEAFTLFGMARVERDRGDLSRARSHGETGLTIVESLRAKVASEELRASYLAFVQGHYEFQIDLLMRLHHQRRLDGFDVVAFETSERARARSLLELLTEAGAEIRQGVDSALLERERSLHQRLNDKADRQMRLLIGKHTEEAAAAAAKELAALATELQEVEGQIRTNSPRYAALTQPQPLSLRDIQDQVLDRDTLLLEYALGEERSYLWAVTQTSLASYELPKRADIESAAQQMSALLTARSQNRSGENARQQRTRIAQADAQWSAAATRLSDMLLAPVASHLTAKRVLIVADGALQYVPFAALPLPKRAHAETDASSDAAPLITQHEVVSLPSASVLAVLRRELAARKPAAKAVAVLADPVFDAEDRRLAGGITTPAQQATSARREEMASELERALRDVGLTPAGPSPHDSKRIDVKQDGLRLPRLPFTRREAEAILTVAPAGAAMKALDFQASRTTATSPELSDYRIVHFATHGLLDSVHPELSGLVLSLVDARGQPQDGFLRLHDIYNLHLPADLVVLSACQTGLGKQIRGEGLVGLTRGFMYAGAERVVASLWKVDDVATAELMETFYRGILVEGLRPAAALRAAQIAMWSQRRRHAPYYWAAFILQGEWR